MAPSKRARNIRLNTRTSTLHVKIKKGNNVQNHKLKPNNSKFSDPNQVVSFVPSSYVSRKRARRQFGLSEEVILRYL